MNTLSIVSRLCGEAAVAGWNVGPFTPEEDDPGRAPLAHITFMVRTDNTRRSCIQVKVYFKVSESKRWVFHRARLCDAMGTIHHITDKTQLKNVLGIVQLPQLTDHELELNLQDIVMQYIRPGRYSSTCRRCGNEMKGHAIIRVASIRNISTSMWVHHRCIRTRHTEDEF